MPSSRCPPDRASSRSGLEAEDIRGPARHRAASRSPRCRPARATLFVAAPQAVPAAANVSVGQADDVPLQVSATSQMLSAGRQTVPAGANAVRRAQRRRPGAGLGDVAPAGRRPADRPRRRERVRRAGGRGPGAGLGRVAGAGRRAADRRRRREPVGRAGLGRPVARLGHVAGPVRAPADRAQRRDARRSGRSATSRCRSRPRRRPRSAPGRPSRSTPPSRSRPGPPGCRRRTRRCRRCRSRRRSRRTPSRTGCSTCTPARTRRRRDPPSPPSSSRSRRRRSGPCCSRAASPSRPAPPTASALVAVQVVVPFQSSAELRVLDAVGPARHQHLPVLDDAPTAAASPRGAAARSVIVPADDQLPDPDAGLKSSVVVRTRRPVLAARDRGRCRSPAPSPCAPRARSRAPSGCSSVDVPSKSCTFDTLAVPRVAAHHQHLVVERRCSLARSGASRCGTSPPAASVPVAVQVPVPELGL